MIKIILAAGFVLSTVTVQADTTPLLDSTHSSTSTTKSGQLVPMEEIAIVNGQPITLKTLGAGLRKKLFLPVYIDQLLTDKNQDPAQYQSAGQSNPDFTQVMANNTAVAITMKFKMKVNSGQLVSALEDGLNKNNVDMNKPIIKTFINVMTAYNGVDSDQSLLFLLIKNPDGTVTLSFQKTNEPVTTLNSLKDNGGVNDTDLEKEIISISLGQTDDRGIQSMQQQIAQGI